MHKRTFTSLAITLIKPYVIHIQLGMPPLFLETTTLPLPSLKILYFKIQN